MEYLQQDRKLGLMLIVIGLGFTLFGLLFLLDKGFLALGNLAITIGLGYFIGFVNFGKFIFRNGITCFASFGYILGLLLILKSHIYTGLVIEMVSFLCLFKPVAGLVVAVLKFIPGLGGIIDIIQK
ncbi:Got1_family protein [Hexamita inflata]|uniref:Putative n=1 Tax=Hexamita inflata TaxID=28002 RepID=A0ABP1H6W0_9EUKA